MNFWTVQLVRSFVSFLLLLLLLPGRQSVVADENLTNEQLLMFVRERHEKPRITSFPTLISAIVAEACRPPQGFETADKNPHWQRAIHVYSNEKGTEPMWDPYATFPVGSVLLKEKFAVDEPGRPELFTGMLKREQGFAPEIGDWEFFTVDGNAKEVTARGKLENCIGCHKEYQRSDFVTKQYAANMIRPEKRFRNGAWDFSNSICCGTSDTIYLPAVLAEPHGTSKSRAEAEAVWMTEQASNPNLSQGVVPNDLSPFGGPTLRYEPDLKKNTLGYWVNVEDSAHWKFEVAKPGNYVVSVLQGCGKGSGGSEVSVEIDDTTLLFVVEDTGHFQNFVWREIGKVKLESEGIHCLTVKPNSKPGAAVMDLRQVRLTLEKR